jgi:hypothetical protein
MKFDTGDLYKTLWLCHFLYYLHWSMVPTGCPKTLIRNYHYLLCNNLEERSFHVSLCLDQTVLMTTSYEDLCISVYMSIHIPVLHVHTSCLAVDVSAIRKARLDLTSYKVLCAWNGNVMLHVVCFPLISTTDCKCASVVVVVVVVVVVLLLRFTEKVWQNSVFCVNVKFSLYTP